MSDVVTDKKNDGVQEIPGFGRLDEDRPGYFDREAARAGEAIPLPGIVDDEAGAEEPAEPEVGAAQPRELEQPDSPEIVEIVVDGQVHRVLRDKLNELAAKGMKYAQEVEPLKEVVSLVRSDPGAQQVLEQYLRSRIAGAAPQKAPQVPAIDFEPDPITQYQDEKEWLRANINRALNMYGEKIAKNIAASAFAAQRQAMLAEQIKLSLAARDPEHHQLIVAKMLEDAKQLPKERYDRVQTDIAEFMRYYEETRSKVLGQQNTANPPSAQAVKPQPTAVQQSTAAPAPFRVRSGGGLPPTATNREDEAWVLPREKFLETLAKVKGYV